eukprot:12921892-Prorocentrum_lima.AAC.1
MSGDKVADGTSQHPRPRLGKSVNTSQLGAFIRKTTRDGGCRGKGRKRKVCRKRLFASERSSDGLN